MKTRSLIVLASLPLVLLVGASAWAKTSEKPEVDGGEITPVQSSEGEVATEVKEGETGKPLKVKLNENTTLHTHGTDHSKDVGNPNSTAPGTLRGNEPSMAPAIQVETTFKDSSVPEGHDTKGSPAQ